MKDLNPYTCLKCKGPLKIEENALICDKCKLKYTFSEGIPIISVDVSEKAS